MSAPENPRLSLGVLSYCRPALIGDAITSALHNADEPMEVLLHDDGSDGPTRDLLLRFLDVGWLSHLMLNPQGHNEGVGVAMNRLFAVASGDVLVKCDQDLLFLPGWQRKVLDVLDRNRSADEPRIGCLGLFKYHAEPVRWQDKLIRSHDGWDEVEDFVGSCMVIPRDAWEVFGPFAQRSPAFAEDYDFKMRVTEASGWCCALMQEDLVVNRGFGLGPSTVVVPDANGRPTSALIKEGPRLIEPLRS